MTLQRWLEANDRTQTWVAKMLGVHRSTVSRWLDSLSAPRPARLAVEGLTNGAVKADEDWR